MASEVEIRPLVYNTVAASQTAQKLINIHNVVVGTASGAGSVNDDLESLLIVPATTSPGSVAILDGTTSITVFAGGTNSVGDLKPFLVPIGARSRTGAWAVTTGANVSVIAAGRFS